MLEAQTKHVGSLVRRPMLATVLAVSAVVPVPAIAATDVYMKISGIEGESTDNGRDGWIDVLSLAAKFDRNADNGSSAAVAAGKPTCAPLVVRKLVDKASPPLLDAVMTLKAYPTVDVEFVRAGDQTPEVYLKFELENVRVTSYQFNGAGDDTPTESLALNFSKMSETYYSPVRDGGMVGTTASVFCGK